MPQPASTPERADVPSASPSPAAPRVNGAADSDGDYQEDASSSYLYEEDREDEEEEEEEEEEEYEEIDAQEELLTFSAFSLDPAMARDHHRIVTFHCFTHFIAVGTNQGFVLLFDYAQEKQKEETQGPLTETQGNAPCAALTRSLHHHTEPIQDVSCTADERYLASIDRTGTVAIQSLVDEADVWTRRTDTPLSSIALHPLYGSLDQCPFLASSGEKVLLWTRSSLMLGHRRGASVSDPHGKVHLVRWCHTACDLVAWLTERGVCVYDIESRQSLRFIARPTQGVIRQPSLYPPTLLWDALALPALQLVSPLPTSPASHGLAPTLPPPQLEMNGHPNPRDVKVSGASSSLPSPLPQAQQSPRSATATAANTSPNQTSTVTTSVLCWGWADWVQEAHFTALPRTNAMMLSSPAALSAPLRTAPTATTTSPAMTVAGRWQVRLMPSLLTTSTSNSNESGAAVSDSRASSSQHPDRYLYPDAPLAGTGSNPRADSQGGLHDEDERLSLRVCGLVPFGTDCYVILAAMVDPTSEATITDLEVRIVERANLNPLYRGRLLVPLVHPLQLSLSGIWGRASAAKTASNAKVSPYTSARASSLTHHESASRADSGLASSHGRATSTPSPGASPGTASFASGQAGATAPFGTTLVCHPLGPSEREREGCLSALYTDPTRSHMFPPDDAAYWIVALNTIVRATPADLDDHVAYLLAQGDLREAYAHAKPRAHLLQRHRVKAIGQALLAQMLEEVDESERDAEQLPSSSSRASLPASEEHAPATIDEIVACLPDVLQDDYAQWERWIYTLDQRGDSWRISPFLPTTTTTSLVEEVVVPEKAESEDAPSLRRIGAPYYNLVLLRCLERDPVLFNDTLHRCEGLYDAQTVLKPLELRYKAAVAKSHASPTTRQSATRVAAELDGAADDSDMTLPDRSASTSAATLTNNASSSAIATAEGDRAPVTLSPEEARLYALGESFGHLLRLVGRDEEALEVLLRVERSRELFTFIRSKGLYGKALDMLPGLFARSAERTLKLLLEHATSAAQFGPGNTTASIAASSPPDATPVLDPLRPEQVVQRLQSTDRRYLWQYLVAVRQSYPDVFSGIARRHAQLVATLYMDYSPQDLLAFLKEMSMYLDKMKEIYALCKKNQLIEEMLFIMARLGKEEEGVRVIVEQQKNMRKAVDFVLSIPSRSEQQTLFRRLVDLAVETQEGFSLYRAPAGSRHASTTTRAVTSHENGDGADETAAAVAAVDDDQSEAPQGSPRMPSAPPFAPKRVSGDQMRYNRCFTHRSQRGETIADIATRFDVPTEAILDANHITTADNRPETVAETASHTAAPALCVVPVNLLASLLVTVADPAYSDNPAIDVRYVLACLPQGEPLPGAAACIAAVLHERAVTVDFQTTVLTVSETDLSAYYGSLLMRRTAAVRMQPTRLSCAHCGQREVASFLPRSGGEACLQACRNALLRAREMPSLTGTGAGLPASAATHASWMDKDGGVLAATHATAATASGTVVFPCHHAYHPACLVQSMVADGSLRDGCNANTVELGEFLQHPQQFAAPRLNRVLPYCRLCMQTSGAPSK